MKLMNRLRGIARDVGVGYVTWATGTMLVNLYLGNIVLYVAGLAVFLAGVGMIAFALSGDEE